MSGWVGNPEAIRMSEKSPIRDSSTKSSLPHGCSTVGFDADPVIDGVSKTLLTAKIPLGRLDRDVAQ
jgi:hypothetical protein